MLDPSANSELPPIPAKRYFTIGEVSELCAVKQHVLRYWEQEFPTLKPIKRRGNRRYYQRQDVILIRQIRSLLWEHEYTIAGARAEGSQEVKGTIKPGKLADLVLLDQDPITVEEKRLKDVRTLMTIVGGKVAWEAGKD